MGLFKAERVFPARMTFQSVGTPVDPVNGDMWYDVETGDLTFYINGQYINLSRGDSVLFASTNTVPVTATNPSTAANLMSTTIPGDTLLTVGSVISLQANGMYSIASGQFPTVNVGVTLGGVSLLSWTSGSTTSSASNQPWNFQANIAVHAVGTSLATMESHGSFQITMGNVASGPQTTFSDTNTSVSTGIDVTVQQVLQVTTTLSSSNAGNSVTQRMFTVQIGI